MTFISVLVLALTFLNAHAEVNSTSRSLVVSSNIRINQVGFYTKSSKLAAVVNAVGDDFFFLSSNLVDTVFRGKLGVETIWDASNEKTRLADFSEFMKPGQYVFMVPGVGVSSTFLIGDHAYLDLTRGSIRAYYYQRASQTLDKAYAGKWARIAGHPDRHVFVHASAASIERPAESQISSPGGWYDAGDYGKYVVNSGISTYTLLALYQHYPTLFDTLKLNIPESANALPDLLDEALWNFRWMLSMQDPSDGGVYHKLTTAAFSAMIMPDADKAKRYVVQKSVTATLDMAATAAYASRLFRKFEGRLPGLADSALTASRRAWDWARRNPTAYYRQTENNKTFSPPITTGEYGDGSAADEFQWAGTELYLATKEDSFFTVAFPNGFPKSLGTPGWPSVASLGFYSMADEVYDQYPLIDSSLVHKRVVDAATIFRNASTTSPFRIPMGAREFYWGSNATCGNQGMLMLQAFRITGDTSFVRGAVDALDYLLGKNGTSHSYVTGFGYQSPMHPHHRPSIADGVVDPVPGLLVGGPNPNQQDGCTSLSTYPALAWNDLDPCYASNEVAINWNAPLAYLAGSMEAIYSGNLSGPQAIRPDGKRTSYHESASLIWEGDAPKLQLPQGRAGWIEFFNPQGKRWTSSRLGDPTQMGLSRPGLLIFRLRLQTRGGLILIRTGFWSTMSPLRIAL